MILLVIFKIILVIIIVKKHIKFLSEFLFEEAERLKSELEEDD